MLDSALLEIVLGLAFVFTLFSLLVSATNEIIVALFKSRAASLWDGISILLGGNDNLRNNFFNHSLIRSLTPPNSWGYRNIPGRRNGPSYIAARTFAVVLLDLLKNPHQVLKAIEAELTRTITELRTGNTKGLESASKTLKGLVDQLQLSATPRGNEVKKYLQELQQQLTDANKSAEKLVPSVEAALQGLSAYWLEALCPSGKRA